MFALPPTVEECSSCSTTLPACSALWVFNLTHSDECKVKSQSHFSSLLPALPIPNPHHSPPHTLSHPVRSLNLPLLSILLTLLRKIWPSSLGFSFLFDFIVSVDFSRVIPQLITNIHLNLTTYHTCPFWVMYEYLTQYFQNIFFCFLNCQGMPRMKVLPCL